jgi:hypothetical protein
VFGGRGHTQSQLVRSSPGSVLFGSEARARTRHRRESVGGEYGVGYGRMVCLEVCTGGDGSVGLSTRGGGEDWSGLLVTLNGSCRTWRRGRVVDTSCTCMQTIRL